MKKLILFAAVLVSIPVSAADVVGFATLKYLAPVDQPTGACDKERSPKDSLECIEFTYWLRYRLVGLVDFTSRGLGSPTAVLATHSPRKGKWLVVLKKLDAGESKKFGAEFMIIDGGPVFESVCLNEPLEKYSTSETVPEQVGTIDEQHCYDISELKRKPNPR
jgi:hypothetical protein